MRYNDYLGKINYDFIQDDSFLKLTQDTVNLGMYMDDLKGHGVLDIGTNTGALLLYAHFHKAGKLTGIDINSQALCLASENISKYTNDFELINVRLQDFIHGQFDNIVCNPPFFKKESTKTENSDIAKAMFDDEMPLDDLLSSIARLLKDNGTAYLIYQTERLQDFLSAAEKYKLRVYEMQILFNNKNESHRFLVKLKHGKTSLMRLSKA